MKLHKARQLFKEKKWLRGAIHHTTLFGEYTGGDIEDYIQRVLHGICFWSFDNLSMDAKPTWHDHFIELGNFDLSQKVRFRVTYAIVCNIEGCMDMYWSVDRPTTTTADTIKETITKIEKSRKEEYPNKRIRYTAVVRRKFIVSGFGRTDGLDIFEFPEGWQPPAV